MAVATPPRSLIVMKPAPDRGEPAWNAGDAAEGVAPSPGAGVRPGLPMRFPVRHHLRRRKRWWRQFMSPVWLALGAPALLLPVLVMILLDEPAMPSLVEQAISSLPIPGDASDPDRVGDARRVAVMGATGGAMPSTVSASLYSNSARADAERLARQSDPRNVVRSIVADSYRLLHPRSLAGEDLMVGEFVLLTSNPGPDIGWAIFNAYCQSAPTEGAPLEKLPISQDVVSAIVNFVPATDYAKLCPRLG